MQPLLKFQKYPIGGSGFSKKYSYYDPIGITTVRTSYIHNGYMFFTYRMGIPLTICFIIALILFLIKGERNSRSTKDEFYRFIAIGGATSIVMMIITNFITTTFMSRESIFVMAISFAW